MHISRQELTTLLPKLKKVHFIGITSPFCSFCASHLISKGVTVTASELNQGTIAAQVWIQKGILFPGEHNKKFIKDNLDLIIFPNGAVQNNPEIDQTLKLGLPYTTVQEILGVISGQFKTIAIAGTHGKTTTTSLIVWLLHQTIGTPNFIVGDAKDKIEGLETNWESHPESDYLVIEACEYKKQFLDRVPSPYISVITHIELDHTDYYHSQDQYNAAFKEFIAPTKKAIIINVRGKNESLVLKDYKGKGGVVDTETLKNTFSSIESRLYGSHNQENLIRAAGIGQLLGLTPNKTREALSTFPGVSSRFEYKGTTLRGALVYKDFAHNPSKIQACLRGAKEAHPKKQIIAVYQPHNFERTYTFKNELAHSLADSDVVIIPNIYSIRENETDRSLITALDFVTQVKRLFPAKKVFYTEDMPPYMATAKKIAEFDSPNSIVILMSAGDLDLIISNIVA